MLRALRVQNFALIDQLTLDIQPGFTVLTGETGAGKSILLGALQLALGGRADVQSLALDGQKCVVEADFILEAEDWAVYFEEQDWDFANVTTLRREITPSGKSRSFVNDTPVLLEALKALSEQLIDIHSQRDSAILTQAGFLSDFLDEVGQDKSAKTQFDLALQTFHAAKKERDAFVASLGSGFDPAYTQYVYDEILTAQLKEEEEDQLREELRTLSNAEAIQSLYADARTLLEGPMGVLEQMGKYKSIMDRLARYSDLFSTAQEGAQWLDENSQEALFSMDRIQDQLQINPARLLEIEARLAIMDGLERKHHVRSISELLSLADKWGQQLETFADAGRSREKAEEALLEADQALHKASVMLHEKRMAVMPSMLHEVHASLAQLNMAEAIVRVVIVETPEYTPRGKYQYNFIFTANPGAPALPLGKVASGGERNRLMLALKALFARGKGLRTLLLDEIDSGVSGGTAAKMADLFKAMAKDVQLIAITHLPQVAGAGSQHWQVQKWVDGSKTHTRLKVLSAAQRVEEVARLLAGEAITDTARAQAQTLLKS